FQYFARNRTWQVPTLVMKSAVGRLGDPTLSRDRRRRLLPDMVGRFWAVAPARDGVRLPLLGISLSTAGLEGHRRLFRREGGVGLLAGTDCPFPGALPGFGVHDELALFVKAGLTPAEALRTATIHPARFFGWEQDLGTVEASKLADLVLLAGNPLEKVSNV